MQNEICYVLILMQKYFLFISMQNEIVSSMQNEISFLLISMQKIVQQKWGVILTKRRSVKYVPGQAKFNCI